MAEYIEREEAMHIAFKSPFFSDALMEEMKAIPAADVAPVLHGRWELHYEVINGELIPSDKKHVCSECKDIWETSSKLNYCPNCGAKMDGGTQNEQS